MIDRLNVIENKYNELTDELSKPETLSDIKKMTELSKEQVRLGNIVEVYNRYRRINEDIASAKEMVKDADMAEFAKEELDKLEEELSSVNSE